MKKLKVHSFPPAEKLKSIANVMDVPYEKKGREFRLELPDAWGTGSITALQFDGGFGLLIYDCEFREEVELHFVDDDFHPLKFMYCLDSAFSLLLENREKLLELKKYHSAIFASRGRQRHIFRFPAGQPLKIRNIEIDRHQFHRRFSCDDVEYESKLQDIFQDHDEYDAFCHDGMYSVTLGDLFKKIEEFPNNGISRTVFFEGVTLEILSEQLSLYEDDLSSDGLQKRLREFELDCISQAAAIIEDELENVDTVPGLARRVGTNVNKLQEGFKIMYKMTVNQYIHETRMKRSLYLLKHSQFNISEIVDKVGLNSKSYFSKIFKDAYGVTPTDYKKKIFKLEDDV